MKFMNNLVSKISKIGRKCTKLLLEEDPFTKKIKLCLKTQSGSKKATSEQKHYIKISLIIDYI
jgi:hypothetical protein